MSALICAYCGEEVSVKRAWTEIVGWTHPRPGGQGGTNSVSLRVPTGRLACDVCVNRRRMGIPEEQGRLV